LFLFYNRPVRWPVGTIVVLAVATLALAAAALIALVLLVGGYSGRAGVSVEGIPPCAPGADGDLFSSDALQCWLPAPRGSWRILSIDSANGAAVITVEARNPRDATDIAERFVASASEGYSELLVYVQRRPDPRVVQGEIIRVRWTRRRGFEELRIPPAGR
jgi:hypothetical protein